MYSTLKFRLSIPVRFARGGFLSGGKGSSTLDVCMGSEGDLDVSFVSRGCQEI